MSVVRLSKKQALTFFRNNARSRLAHNAEDARHPAYLVPNGRIGDVEVYVLRVAVPLDIERTVLSEYCLAGLENAPQKRLKIIP